MKKLVLYLRIKHPCAQQLVECKVWSLMTEGDTKLDFMLFYSY